MAVIEHLRSQGIDLVVLLDNGSTDGSYESCSRYVGKGILSQDRLFTEQLEFDRLLSKLYEMALLYTPDWVLLNVGD